MTYKNHSYKDYKEEIKNSSRCMHYYKVNINNFYKNINNQDNNNFLKILFLY